jgi:hypothetical protein
MGNDYTDACLVYDSRILEGWQSIRWRIAPDLIGTTPTGKRIGNGTK